MNPPCLFTRFWTLSYLSKYLFITCCNFEVGVAGMSFTEFGYNTNNYVESGEARDKMILAHILI